MSDVVRRSRDLSPTRAGARSTGSVTWQSATRLPWSLWPAQTQAADPGGDLVLAHAQTCPEVREVLDGVEHFTAVVWRAHRDGLFVARAAMPHDGVPGPDGAPKWLWRHLEHSWLPAQGPPTLTRGVVPAGASTAEATEVATEVAPTAEGRTAAAAHMLLPDPVRQGLHALVPGPALWLGQVTQESGQGADPRLTVATLRVDHARAVAVVATKVVPAGTPGDDVAWDVTQVVYAQTGAAQLSGRGSAAQLSAR